MILRALPLGALLAVACSVPALAHSKPPVPAGGGAIDQVIGGTVVSLALIAGMVFMSVKYRRGRVNALRKLGALAERRMALPAWAALPLAVQGTSLIVAVFGMYWDISIHLDEGRDTGPFANTAHYFILVGLFGITAAGLLAMVMPKVRPSPTAVSIRDRLCSPLGGVLMFVCAGFALAAFPMDDMWHRIFGQDVTLWGPTHLVLFGAAALSTVGTWILLVEGLQASRRQALPKNERFLKFQQIAMAGAFLIALS